MWGHRDTEAPGAIGRSGRAGPRGGGDVGICRDLSGSVGTRRQRGGGEGASQGALRVWERGGGAEMGGAGGDGGRWGQDTSVCPIWGWRWS